ncbi:MAG: lytic transglycosylase domain-containing protein [Candidatus Eremiobacteraeota bacterium]|nr:lytic transglycosylase domain-containing protein [Candidatus Eremiobacteraeota bacterium]
MDITADLAAVTTRIAEITGTPPQSFTGTGDAGSSGSTPSFASMVAQALQNQGAQTAGAPVNAPAMIPPAQLEQLVQANGTSFGVDPALIKAIIANESGFNANATSRTGAQGLMQLEPDTAVGVGVSDAYDPAQNIYGGTRYIKGLLDRFHGDLHLAVAAYNAGPGAVEKYGDVPPYAETQNYVQNVIASYRKYSAQK